MYFIWKKLSAKYTQIRGFSFHRTIHCRSGISAPGTFRMQMFQYGSGHIQVQCNRFPSWRDHPALSNRQMWCQNEIRANRSAHTVRLGCIPCSRGKISKMESASNDWGFDRHFFTQVDRLSHTHLGELPMRPASCVQYVLIHVIPR